MLGIFKTNPNKVLDIAEKGIGGIISDIDKLIDESIKALVDGDIKHGADQLYELAVCFAKADLGQTSFENLRGYIIQEAIRKTDEHFIQEKLKIIERENYERRHRAEKNRKITKQNLKIIH